MDHGAKYRTSDASGSNCPDATLGNSHRAMNEGRWSSIRRFASGFLVVTLSVGVAWPFLPRRFESTAAIILRPADEDGRLDRAQALRMPLDENAIQSEMDIIGSPAIASAVIVKHRLSVDPEFGDDPESLRMKLTSAAYQAMPFLSAWLGPLRGIPEGEIRARLKKHLSVSRDRRSYTVKLGYWSSDPAKAAAMTETLLSAYLDDQAARKFRSFEKLTTGLSQRVETLREKYESSERAIRQLMAKSDLTDGVMQTTLENQLNTLAKEAAEARVHFLEATTRSSQLQRGASPLETAKPASWQQGDASNPTSDSDDVEARQWALREALLGRAMKAIQEELAERREASLRLENLRREAAIDKEVLDAALLRLKEQASRASSANLDVEILAHPDAPLRPVFPDLLLTLLGTLIAACTAGATMVWHPLRHKIQRMPLHH